MPNRETDRGLVFVQIGVTIIDDNQWEPDEEFFVKLTLIPGEESENVRLGRTSIMEITILNDDGKLTFSPLPRSL